HPQRRTRLARGPASREWRGIANVLGQSAQGTFQKMVAGVYGGLARLVGPSDPPAMSLRRERARAVAGRSVKTYVRLGPKRLHVTIASPCSFSTTPAPRSRTSAPGSAPVFDQAPCRARPRRGRGSDL